MAKLDKEERSILKAYEAGEFVPVKEKGVLERYRRYARAALQKDRRINIRLSSLDLQGIQRKAIEEGIPYQTLISSVIHKYVSGTLVPRQP